jgi:hypothetical protein
VAVTFNGLNTLMRANTLNLRRSVVGWDIDSGDFGVRCVVGIDLGHAPSVLELANLQAVDALIDDGDLATGIFQGFDRNRRGYLLVE